MTNRPSGTIPIARSLLLILGSLFFITGAIALVYEVLWQRRLALLFGSAGPATAAVLAAYFAGLGLGSRLLGRRSARLRRSLRTYALLELTVGLGALLVVPLLDLYGKIYPALFTHFAHQPFLFLVIKAALTFVALLVPTFCMGGTLPVLGQLVDQGQRHLGLTAGWLYAVNTAGAALGALAAPFLIFPLGATGALFGCAAGNVLVALFAWRLDRQWPEMVVSTSDVIDQAIPAPSPPPAAGLQPGFLGLAALSGAALFALQVLWNRAFAQVHENSLYSFSVIVALFILALALGAQLARVALRRAMAPQRILAWGWILGGSLVALSPFVFLHLTDQLNYLATDGSWNRYVLRLVLVAAAVLLVPISLLGTGLPMILEVAGRRHPGQAGDLLGRLLAANIVGAVVGALLAGFILPFWCGLWGGMLLLAGVLLLGGFWQLYQRPGQPKSRGGQLICAVILLLLGLASRHVSLPRTCVAQKRGERLLALSEGAHGIAAVVERRGSRRLKLNNHYVLGGTASVGDERMQAHLPLLVHPAPRRVAFLGVGTGISAGGALFHPVEQLTAIELVPEVIEAARLHFHEANAGVLQHKSTRVVVEDARNFLRGTDATFDVVVGDLVVPWRQGEGALFTLESFQAVKKSLAPGGIYCQWLPLFQLSETELQILVRTFLYVFPQAQVWRGDFSPSQPAIALMASRGQWVLEPATVERRLRELRPDPLNPQLGWPEGVWMNYVGNIYVRDLPLDDTRINSEEHPWVELLGPLRHAGEKADSLCTGRRLQTWLTTVKQKSLARPAGLTPREATASDSGALLLEFSLLLSEKREREAMSVQARLKNSLARELYLSIFPEAPPAR